VGSVELKDDARLENIFTGYVVETLKSAGYQTVIMDLAYTGTPVTEKVPVILEGMITAFWINTMVKAQSRVEVALILRDADSGDGLWATSIYGYGESILWMGASSEFEDSIRQAVDEALNKAAAVFVSDAFYEIVNKTTASPASNTIH
jgi:hypothetical protein